MRHSRANRELSLLPNRLSSRLEKICVHRQKFGWEPTITRDPPSSNFQHLIYVKPFSNARKAASFHEGRDRNYRKPSREYFHLSRRAFLFFFFWRILARTLAEGRNIRWDMRSFVWFNAYILLLLLLGDGARFNRRYLREAIGATNVAWEQGRNHLRVRTKIKLIVTILWIFTLSECLHRR